MDVSITARHSAGPGLHSTWWKDIRGEEGADNVIGEATLDELALREYQAAVAASKMTDEQPSSSVNCPATIISNTVVASTESVERAATEPEEASGSNDDITVVRVELASSHPPKPDNGIEGANDLLFPDASVLVL